MLPLELQADELIRAIKAGEQIPLDILKTFILTAQGQHDENRKKRIKEENKKLSEKDIDFF